MAGVDVDNGMVKTMMASRNGAQIKKGFSLKLRLPRNGNQVEAAKKEFISKYTDHPLLQVIDMTLRGQGVGKDDVIPAWNGGQKPKRKLAGREKDGEPNSKKRKKSSHGKSSKKKSLSFKVKFKTTVSKSPPATTKEEVQTPSPQETLTQPALHQTPTKPITESTVHTATLTGQAKVESCSVAVAAVPETFEKGVQCEVPKLPKEPVSPVVRPPPNSVPPASPPPTLEDSLVRVQECLAGFDQGVGKKHYRQIWEEGRRIKQMAEAKRNEDYGFTVEVISLYLHSAVKFMEAGGLQEESSSVTMDTGKLLFVIASYCKKMLGNDFVRQGFRILSERLGALAYLRYSSARHDDRQVFEKTREALKVVRTTTQELADMRTEANEFGQHGLGAIALIESVLMNGGLGPLSQHLKLARKAVHELERIGS